MRPVAHPSRRGFAAPQDEAEFCARSRCQTAKHHRPVFGSGSGAPVSFFLPRTESEGAERRAAHPVVITLRRQACETHLAHRGHLAFEMPRLPALHLRRFLPQGRSNSAGQTPQAFACVVRLPLQRAGPRIRAGQLPEASRGVIASHAAGAAPAGSGFTRFRPRQVAPSKRTPLDDAPG